MISSRLRPSMSKISYDIFVLFALTILTGCSTLIDSQIELGYQPGMEQKSPLSTLSPLLINVRVIDQRDSIERQLIGYKIGGFGNITASVRTQQDIPNILGQALEEEFRNNGHTIVAPRHPRTDATLEVRLKKFWSQPTVRLFDVQMHGTVDAEIEIKNSQGQSIGSRVINGTQLESWQLAVDEAFQSVLNGALTEFVRRFARDPNVLKLLETMRSQSGTERPAQTHSRGALVDQGALCCQSGWQKFRLSTTA